QLPFAIFGHLRDRLKQYLPALKSLLLINLLSVSWIAASGGDTQGDATPLYEYINNYKYTQTKNAHEKPRLGNASPLFGSLAPPSVSFHSKKNKIRAWEAFADRGPYAHPLFNDPE